MTLAAVNFGPSADRYGWGSAPFFGWPDDPCAGPPPWVDTLVAWSPPEGCPGYEVPPINIGLEEEMTITGKPAGGGGGLLFLGLLAAVVLLSD